MRWVLHGVRRSPSSPPEELGALISSDLLACFLTGSVAISKTVAKLNTVSANKVTRSDEHLCSFDCSWSKWKDSLERFRNEHSQSWNRARRITPQLGKTKMWLLKFSRSRTLAKFLSEGCGRDKAFYHTLPPGAKIIPQQLTRVWDLFSMRIKIEWYMVLFYQAYRSCNFKA